MVRRLVDGTVTFSWYVPARRTTVPPLAARVTARPMVFTGAAWVPALASLPLGLTNSAPAGTAYDAVPSATAPADAVARPAGGGVGLGAGVVGAGAGVVGAGAGVVGAGAGV